MKNKNLIDQIMLVFYLIFIYLERKPYNGSLYAINILINDVKIALS